MNKNKRAAPPSVPGSTSLLSGGYILYDYAVQHLEGELLTFVEGLGLRETQEKAAKDILRSIYYRAVYQNAQYITGEQAYKVRTENENMARSSSSPVPSRN